jgi:hypothetical protein
MFSIFCSLAFSLTVTDKKDLLDTAEGMRINAAIEAVQGKLNEIEAVKQLSRTDVESHPDIVKLRDEVEMYRSEYNMKRDQHAQITANRQRLGGRNDENAAQYDSFTAQINAAYTEYTQANRKMNEAQGRLDVRRSTLTEIKSNNVEELAKLNDEMGALKQMYSLETATPIIELQARLSDYEASLLSNSGSEKMFVILANMFGATPRWLKFAILLFLSILIELTVWQCGPDLQITPTILRHFKRSLPRDANVPKILKLFKEEYEKFSDSIERTDKPVEMKPIREETIERVIEQKVEPRVRRTKPERVVEKPIPVYTPPPVVELESEAYVEPVVEKEHDVVPEQAEFPVVDHEISESVVPGASSIHYRFGTTSEAVRDKFVQFVKMCVDKQGEFIRDPIVAARNMKISDKLRDVFLRRLQWLHLEKSQLIEQVEDRWVSHFDADRIIEYSTEVVKETD